jgi:hypothetical protein
MFPDDAAWMAISVYVVGWFPMAYTWVHLTHLVISVYVTSALPTCHTKTGKESMVVEKREYPCITERHKDTTALVFTHYILLFHFLLPFVYYQYYSLWWQLTRTYFMLPRITDNAPPILNTVLSKQNKNNI